MSHLSPDRLLLLGLSPDDELSRDEAEHLGGCAACAARLEEERALSAALEEVPQPEPPADFVARTSARFADALAAQRARRTVLMLVTALALGLAVVVPMAGILVGTAGSVLAGIAAAVGYLVTVGHALLVVFSKLPPAMAAVLLVTCAAALASSMLLGRLAVAVAPAK